MAVVGVADQLKGQVAMAFVVLKDPGRAATPAEALRAGADHIVVARPIRDAADPVRAARAIVAEIAGRLALGR